MDKRISFLLCVLEAILLSSCSGPSITAVRLSPTPPGEAKEPEGIPYYLPKPYLFVTKNFYYIPAPTVGLTATVPIPGSFDTSSSSNPQDSTGKATNSGSNTPTGKQTNSSPTIQNNSSNTALATPQWLSHDGRLMKAVLLADDQNSNQNGSDGNAAGTNDKSDKEQNGASPGGTNTATGNPTSSNGGTNSPSETTANGGQVPWVYPGTSPMIPAPSSDSLIPQEYFTYQIIYLPDLTQKYGLRIHGGYGELRATENLVNGWMHTGPGPFYMKSSSGADTIAAMGQATGSVLQQVEQGVLSGLGIPTAGAGVQKTSGPGLKDVKTNSSVPPNTILSNYAILYIFEPVVTNKTNIVWRQVCQLSNNAPISFDRDVLGFAGPSNSPPSVAPPSSENLLNGKITNFVTTNFPSYTFQDLVCSTYEYRSNITVKVQGGIGQNHSGLPPQNLKEFTQITAPAAISNFCVENLSKMEVVENITCDFTNSLPPSQSPTPQAAPPATKLK